MDYNKNNEGIDLSHAPEDSGTGVKFEEYQAPRYYPATPKIIKWVIKYSGGLVKDEKQASYVLIGFGVIAIIISLILFFNASSTDDLERIIPKEKYIDPPKPWINSL